MFGSSESDVLILSWVSLLLAVLFRGPETFHCERSVIQTSHWDEENWKPEWDVSHHFGLFKLNCKTSSSSSSFVQQWKTFVSQLGEQSTHTKSKISQHKKTHHLQQKHKNIKNTATPRQCKTFQDIPEQHDKFSQKWLGVVFVTLPSILTILYDFQRMKCYQVSVWKSPKMSHLNFWILAFSTNFWPIKTDLSGNTVWPQASGFQKLAKLDHFWHF